MIGSAHKDFGTYCMDKQPRPGQACAGEQSHHSLHFSHTCTQSMEVEKDSD